jgi:hypothetical protein
MKIVKPETIIGGRDFGCTGHVRVEYERGVRRQLTHFDPKDESCQSRLGGPRIHGELLKLGIDIGETTVVKYMVHPRRPPSQTWKTFLKNHMHDLASTDFFVVPTATFRLLFVFLEVENLATGVDQCLTENADEIATRLRDLAHCVFFRVGHDDNDPVPKDLPDIASTPTPAVGGGQRPLANFPRNP